MTKPPDIVIFTPVGTSLISNQDHLNAKLLNVTTLIPRITRNFIKANELIKAFTPPFHKDINPAEISSLYAFCQKRGKELNEKQVLVKLLYSPGEGKEYADALKILIENDGYFPKPGGKSWQVETVDLANLDPAKPEVFPQAMGELAQKIQEIITDFGGQIYLNITGGYKALPPYLVMISLALRRNVKVFYLFEDTRQIIELPAYPMAFDLLEWRDWRALLYPFTVEIAGVGDKQKQQLRQALQNSKMGTLIEDQPPYALNPIGTMIRQQYEQHRGVGLSEFGSGGLLLERCPTYASYLAKQCIPLWRHLSVGDHIPETVEHGRGHVQRLLELAEQLLTALPELKLSEEQVFVLLSSIWLHDLGHSGDFFAFEGVNGLVQNKDNPNDTGCLSVYGDPDKVRLYHSVLSYQLLKDYRDFLFPQRCRPENSVLYRSVELACLYHRKKMPVKDGNPVAQCQVTKGLSDFSFTEGVIQGFPLVAALLRILDGAENQEERTGNPEYYKIMEWVVDRRVAFLKKQDEFENSTSRLYKEATFKENQMGHFLKHRMVRHVFMVQEGSAPLDPNGVYPQNSNSLAPILGVHLVANQTEDYSRDSVVKDIINGFLEEFLLVQEVLPFRIAIFLVEESDSTTQKWQIIIYPQEDKEAEDWNYNLLEVK